MNKLNSSNIAVFSLSLAFVSMVIVVAAIARHFTMGSTSDPFLKLLAAHQAIQNIGIFIAIIKVGHFASLIAALALIIGIYAVIKAKSTKGQAGSKIALAAVILSFAVIATYFVSIVVYAYTIKRVTDNISTVTKTKSVEEFLRDDIDITFGAPTPSTGNSGKQLIEVPVTIANKKTVAQDYIIMFDAVNEAGERIAENSIYTVRLGAEQTQEYKSTFYYLDAAQLEAMSTARFNITSISEH